MEDRYLFKAKFDDSDRWVKGQLVEVNDTYLIIPNHASKILSGWFSTSNIIEVKKDTICQCTGLKDKNGKLIWENDVVKEITTINFGNDKAKVSWIESEWMLEWKTKCFYRKDMKFWTSEKIIEVIGNIFEGEFNGKNSKKD